MSLQDSTKVSDIKVMLKTGLDGSGISTIEKTSTEGLVDIYTITFDDGRTTNFPVTNGSSIASIAKTSTSGNVDTYTITLTNGDTTTFEVTNGFPNTYEGSHVTIDNTGTDLESTNAQDAIVELNTKRKAIKVSVYFTASISGRGSFTVNAIAPSIKSTYACVLCETTHAEDLSGMVSVTSNNDGTVTVSGKRENLGAFTINLVFIDCAAS